ncbi:MAG: hypothetical protein IPP67_06775 [Rhodospirillaceae bacterium]|nr:hypothetical protein [Rhodospirillaceae bacterium]
MKKINDRLYENEPAEDSQKYQLRQLPDQLILELENFQFRETFAFSEESRNSEKTLLEEENIFLDKEIPVHQKRINCIGRLKEKDRIELINSKNPFLILKLMSLIIKKRLYLGI